jgi:hypothetical protein
MSISFATIVLLETIIFLMNYRNKIEFRKTVTILAGNIPYHQEENRHPNLRERARLKRLKP